MWGLFWACFGGIWRYLDGVLGYLEGIFGVFGGCGADIISVKGTTKNRFDSYFLGVILDQKGRLWRYIASELILYVVG